MMPNKKKKKTIRKSKSPALRLDPTRILYTFKAVGKRLCQKAVLIRSRGGWGKIDAELPTYWMWKANSVKSLQGIAALLTKHKLDLKVGLLMYPPNRKKWGKGDKGRRIKVNFITDQETHYAVFDIDGGQFEIAGWDKSWSTEKTAKAVFKKLDELFPGVGWVIQFTSSYGDPSKTSPPLRAICELDVPRTLTQIRAFAISQGWDKSIYTPDSFIYMAGPELRFTKQVKQADRAKWKAYCRNMKRVFITEQLGVMHTFDWGAEVLDTKPENVELKSTSDENTRHYEEVMESLGKENYIRNPDKPPRSGNKIDLYCPFRDGVDPCSEFPEGVEPHGNPIKDDTETGCTVWNPKDGKAAGFHCQHNHHIHLQFYDLRRLLQLLEHIPRDTGAEFDINTLPGIKESIKAQLKETDAANKLDGQSKHTTSQINSIVEFTSRYQLQGESLDDVLHYISVNARTSLQKLREVYVSKNQDSVITVSVSKAEKKQRCAEDFKQLLISEGTTPRSWEDNDGLYELTIYDPVHKIHQIVSKIYGRLPYNLRTRLRQFIGQPDPRDTSKGPYVANAPDTTVNDITKRFMDLCFIDDGYHYSIEPALQRDWICYENGLAVEILRDKNDVPHVEVFMLQESDYCVKNIEINPIPHLKPTPDNLRAELFKEAVIPQSLMNLWSSMDREQSINSMPTPLQCEMWEDFQAELNRVFDKKRPRQDSRGARKRNLRLAVFHAEQNLYKQLEKDFPTAKVFYAERQKRIDKDIKWSIDRKMWSVQYLCSDITNFSKLMFNYFGEKHSGKSRMLAIGRIYLGRQITTTIFTEFIGKYGKRAWMWLVALFTDESSGEVVKAGEPAVKFRQRTTPDAFLTIRLMRGTEIEISYNAKYGLASNEVLQIEEKSGALGARPCLIRFVKEKSRKKLIPASFSEVIKDNKSEIALYSLRIFVRELLHDDFESIRQPYFKAEREGYAKMISAQGPMFKWVGKSLIPSTNSKHEVLWSTWLKSAYVEFKGNVSLEKLSRDATLHLKEHRPDIGLYETGNAGPYKRNSKGNRVLTHCLLHHEMDFEQDIDDESSNEILVSPSSDFTDSLKIPANQEFTVWGEADSDSA